jgi:hypothetical protein
MIRLNALNRLHGLSLGIHVYNTYYGLDLLRCPIADFNGILSAITNHDVLRLAAMADKSLQDVLRLAV